MGKSSGKRTRDEMMAKLERNDEMLDRREMEDLNWIQNEMANVFVSVDKSGKSPCILTKTKNDGGNQLCA
jgi:hypothetical protein